MPGFESANNSHNKAITEYLDKGVHYLVLEDVTKGGLADTALNKLEVFDNFHKDAFTIFLTKCDIRPPSDIDNVREHVQEQLDDNGFSVKIECISQKDASRFHETLKELDVNKLFKNSFIFTLNNTHDDISSNIDFFIGGLNKTKREKEEIIQDIESSIQAIKNKKESILNSIGRDDARNYMGGILGAIRHELEANVSTIANKMQADTSSCSQYISNLVSKIFSIEIKKL